MMALLLALAFQETRDVIASDRPMEVRVPVSADGKHRATVLTFPEESLEALVAGWNDGELSLERRRENLFLKLLKKAQGDVHVLGASGMLYRLRVIPADEDYDGHVRILAPKESKREANEAIDLIRAMRLCRKPLQGAVLRCDQQLYASVEWTAKAVYVYESQAYRGFVVRVENISSNPMRLDPSRFVSKDLVLIGAREMLLAPGEKTFLYLVFWKAL